MKTYVKRSRDIVRCVVWTVATVSVWLVAFGNAANPNAEDSFGFATWNVGHFALGLGGRTTFDVETELAKALSPVDVAKTNHHGHHSMATPFVAALRPRVWFSCVWDQHHDTADSLERIADRTAYPGERLIAPGIFPAERRFEDVGKPFMSDIAPESFAGGHVVFDVPPGGKDYTLSYLRADDESMTVTGVYHFESGS